MSTVKERFAYAFDEARQNTTVKDLTITGMHIVRDVFNEIKDGKEFAKSTAAGAAIGGLFGLSTLNPVPALIGGAIGATLPAIGLAASTLFVPFGAAMGVVGKTVSFATNVINGPQAEPAPAPTV